MKGLFKDEEGTILLDVVDVYKDTLEYLTSYEMQAIADVSDCLVQAIACIVRFCNLKFDWVKLEEEDQEVEKKINHREKLHNLAK